MNNQDKQYFYEKLLSEINNKITTFNIIEEIYDKGFSKSSFCDEIFNLKELTKQNGQNRMR